MRPRFHVPDLDPSSERIPLPDGEAEHLTRVLRLTAGAEIEVFNGRGGLWRAEVVQAGKRAVFVRVLERLAPAAEIRPAVTLVQSVLKADKMDDVVRDAVMLGVAAIQPVVSARTEIAMATLRRSNRETRWERIAVTSAKQCGRAVLPPILGVTTFAHYFQHLSPAVRLLCVEPAAVQGPVRSVADVAAVASVHVIVGPEGGWTPEEVSSAIDAGALPISLGGRTLRADAVPIVVLTALLTTWGELK